MVDGSGITTILANSQLKLPMKKVCLNTIVHNLIPSWIFSNLWVSTL